MLLMESKRHRAYRYRLDSSNFASNNYLISIYRLFYDAIKES